jgi:hypothetical protein
MKAKTYAEAKVKAAAATAVAQLLEARAAGLEPDCVRSKIATHSRPLPLSHGVQCVHTPGG